MCGTALRRGLELAFFIMVVFIAFAAQSSGYWIHWAAFSALVGFMIVVDYLFLSDNLFIYDPNIKSWAAKSAAGGY